MNFRQFLRSLWKSLGRAPAPKPAPRPAPAPAPPRPAPVPPGPTPAPPRPAPPPHGNVPALLAAHNARRAEAGLPGLAASAKLQAAAQGHAMTMAQLGRMEHSGIGDGDPGSRLRGVGYSWTWAGENIAWNQRTVAEVMTSWLSSPGHRENILSSSFTQAGFALARGTDGSFWWCADFGAPAIRTAYTAEPLTYAMGSPEVTGDGTVAASSIQVVMG
jgi:uncharacterized protein YkwD